MIHAGTIAKLRYELGTGPGLGAYAPVSRDFYRAWLQAHIELYPNQAPPKVVSITRTYKRDMCETRNLRKGV